MLASAVDGERGARCHERPGQKVGNPSNFRPAWVVTPQIGAMVRAMAALDEILATIRRLPLPERLRLIERATLEVAQDTPKPAAVAEVARKLSVDEFLAARLTPPAGVGPVSLQDMERAIAEGATGRGGV